MFQLIGWLERVINPSECHDRAIASHMPINGCTNAKASVLLVACFVMAIKAIR